MTRSRVLSSLMKYGVPLVITVGLCYLLFRDFDFNQMMDIIRTQCDFRWIVLMFVISIFSHIFRGLRWGIQLSALGIKVPVFALVLSIFGTYAVNLVFPRLGEVWRTGYISQRQNASFSEVFGSMVADRLSDTVMVLLLILLAFVLAGPQLLKYVENNSEGYEAMMSTLTSPWLWGTTLAVIVLCGVLMRVYRSTRVVGKIIGVFRSLWQGFAVVFRMPKWGWWLVLTFCIWGCYYVQLYVAFFSFPVTTEVVTTYGPVAVLVCFVLTSISMGVPSNGGIGPWQWALVFGLTSFYVVPGLTKEYAITFANLVMGCQTLLLIALGIFTFICISLGKRKNKLQPVKTPDNENRPEA